MTALGSYATQDVLDFVIQERRCCLSDREWRHRLKGYGYDIRQTSHGRMLTTVTGGVAICALDG